LKSHLEKIDAFIRGLRPELKVALEAHVETKRIQKGDYLLQAGTVCRKSFEITNGAVRKFYLHDGKEITTDLLFSGDIAIDFKSYVLQKPSEEWI
jgi:CRP-like cAMP-binding protein